METYSTLQFGSWTRRGLGAATDAGITSSGVNRRVQMAVTVSAHAGPSDRTDVAQSPSFALLGPADVIGVAPGQIVRRTPEEGDQRQEPNYLAAIEFAHPDMPWLLSLAPTGPADALTPWLMLIVLPRDRSGPIGPAPVYAPCRRMITLPSADSVPAPAATAAFAHVQARTENADLGRGADMLSRAEPGAASRIVCPTRLLPDTEYVAALVPTYRAGVAVGLGIPGTVSGDLWQPSAGLELPVYAEWTFHTGAAGDFKTLCRRLHPVGSAVSAQIGTRSVAIEAVASRMYTEAPEATFDGVATVPTVLTRIPRDPESHQALGSIPRSSFDPLAVTPPASAQILHSRLAALVDVGAGQTSDDPIVGPPLYGQWAACATAVRQSPLSGTADPAGRPTWLEQLNLDPAARIAAGVGVGVVRRDQEELMTQAWTQLQSVVDANRLARWAGLYALSAAQLHRKVTALPEGEAFALLSPAAARIRVDGGETMLATLDKSTVSPALVSPAMSRVARYGVAAIAKTPAAALSQNSIVVALAGKFAAGADTVLPATITGTRGIDHQVLVDLSEDPRMRDDFRKQLGGEDPRKLVDQVFDVAATIKELGGKINPAAEPGLTPFAPGIVLTDAVKDRIGLAGITVDRSQFAVPDLFQRPELAAAEGSSVLTKVVTVKLADAAKIDTAPTTKIGHAATVETGHVTKFGSEAFTEGPGLTEGAGFTEGTGVTGTDKIGTKITGSHVMTTGRIGTGLDLTRIGPKLTDLGAGEFPTFAASPLVGIHTITGSGPVPASGIFDEIIAQGQDADASVVVVKAGEHHADTVQLDLGKVSRALRSVLDGSDGDALPVAQVVARIDRAPVSAAASSITRVAWGDDFDEQLSVSTALQSSAMSLLGLPDTETRTLALLPQFDAGTARRLGDAVASVVKWDVAAAALSPGIGDLETVTPVSAAATLTAGMEPLAAYTKMIDWAVQIGPADGAVRRASVFHPAQAAPRFADPVAARLTELDKNWMLGGVDQVPPDSVSLLAVNTRFVESVLAGANHEMARELLWRGYPTDQRGTCFRSFWPGVEDITAMDGWGGRDLGEHRAGGGGPLIAVLVRGELLRRYPGTLVSLVKGEAAVHDGSAAFTLAEEIRPISSGPIGGDVFYFVLPLDPARLTAEQNSVSPTGADGWFISLQEPAHDARFGLVESPRGAPHVANKQRDTAAKDPWERSDDWSWAGVAGPHLSSGDGFLGASSAEVGAALFRKPFRMLLLATQYIA
ncbi:hypothetical protein [Gordonia sp. (in: high G+C Gram-positive bacteria)]|uniref:hypothetical protein n=1 Tax=Gordonia sp. (in: high G+C Gram-positive bacteria) TaxID=84139 RepID=UPI0035297AE5